MYIIMKNKNVGFLIIGISVIIGIIIFIFNMGLKKIVEQTCVHGPSCTMYDTIKTQTSLSLAIAGIILIIGLFFVFAKENERVILKTKIRTIKEKRKVNLENLDSEEKRIVKIIQEENGAIFQGTLMEKLGIGKVGMTRILDKLEGKQVIERKRRGMNNIVVLK